MCHGQRLCRDMQPGAWAEHSPCHPQLPSCHPRPLGGISGSSCFCLSTGAKGCRKPLYLWPCPAPPSQRVCGSRRGGQGSFFYSFIPLPLPSAATAAAIPSSPQ